MNIEYNTFSGYQSGFINSNGDRNVFLGYQAGFLETGSDKLYIENSDGDAPLIYGDFASDILAVNGRLGIGTQTPSATAKIHTVSNTTGPVDGIVLENQGGPARLVLQNDAITNTATVDQKWIFNSNGTLRLSAGSDAAEFVLDASGNLTVQGSYKVGGTTLNVPDYVFAPGYQLRPLDDLKAYIAEHRHLPEIPSADEVAAQGLDMTDMRVKLLQKVEELTLYTLKQQTTIDSQQANVEQQHALLEKEQQANALLRKDFAQQLAALQQTLEARLAQVESQQSLALQ